VGASQREPCAAEGERGGGIGALGGDGETVCVRADGQPGACAGWAEAGAASSAPRHGRAAAVARVEALGVEAAVAAIRLRDRQGGQPELVAVIQDGRAAQEHEEQQRAACQVRVVGGPARGESSSVVVGPGERRPEGVLEQWAQRARAQRCVEQEEVEGEMQLVVLAVIGGEPFAVEHVSFAEQDRVVG
jgi:hypothetical protein